MRTASLIAALVLGACARADWVPSASPVPPPACEITVSAAPDGRSGTVGCATPRPAPTVAGTQRPPVEKQDKDDDKDDEQDERKGGGKGKGNGKGRD